MLSHFRRIRLFETLWTETRQAPLSMGFSREENPTIPRPLSWETAEAGLDIGAFLEAVESARLGDEPPGPAFADF